MRLTIDEATSNSSGAVYIPGQLAENIRNADIFVADVTAVTNLAGSGDSLPNPNVTFELGIAATHLGWNRCVMLFNTAHAVFDRMPFDFDRHRMSPYSLTEVDARAKRKAGSLDSLVAKALTEVIEKNPERPRELEGKSPDEIKRVRDLENIKWFMRNLSTSVLDRHIRELPDYLHPDAISVYEGINDVIGRTDFYLYDQEVLTEMEGLRSSLEKSLDHIEFYRELPGQARKKFGQPPMSFVFSPEEESARQKVSYARMGMRERLDKLLRLIRERYLEIDIDETSIALYPTAVSMQ